MEVCASISSTVLELRKMYVKICPELLASEDEEKIA